MVVSRAVFITLLSLLLNVKVMQAQNSAGASATPRRQADKASLKGMITDGRTGEALDGASLYFSDLKKGTVSNMQGNYSIRNLPQGRYIVEVSHLGYASIVSHILFNGEMERNFSLSSSVVENEAVTVTGVSSASSVRKSPVPVDILKRQDLLRTASTNLIDALSKTPGVSQITSGPAISKPSIRGLGYNRLVVVNDGVKQEGQQWGDEHGIEIDEYSVNRAEVLKGPASIMYGSDALAGVVNILTNVPVAEGIIKGNVFTNYQTNNGLLGFNGNLAGNIKGLNWNIYGTHKSAIDYMNMRDGRVFNSKFNEKDMGGYIGINKSWGYTHLMISNFNQHLGLIEGEREDRTGKFLKYINSRGIAEQVIATGKDFESRDPFLPRQDIQHFKISSDNSFRTANGRITLNIGFQRNQRKEFGNVLDPSEKELHFDLKTITYNVQYHFPQNKNWETTIGVNGMQQENTNKGVEALIP
ncbi:MAG: TonB-dependent receptor plug domain-containing protein, partial [Chitinophagaceae bacterium]